MNTNILSHTWKKLFNVKSECIILTLAHLFQLQVNQPELETANPVKFSLCVKCGFPQYEIELWIKTGQ